MTPRQRRNKIVRRIKAGDFTVGRVIMESGYTGLRAYLNGGNITDENIYAVEQALNRLEKK